MTWIRPADLYSANMAKTLNIVQKFSTKTNSNLSKYSLRAFSVCKLIQNGINMHNFSIRF